MDGPWHGPWLALGLALAGPWPGPGWLLAWPLAGPWTGPWLALGLNFEASAAVLGFKERFTIYLISPPHMDVILRLSKSTTEDLSVFIGFRS